MIEGSGSGAVSRSGSIPLISGSGSWRPIKIWIRWIRIRIRKTKANFALLRISVLDRICIWIKVTDLSGFWSATTPLSLHLNHFLIFFIKTATIPGVPALRCVVRPKNKKVILSNSFTVPVIAVCHLLKVSWMFLQIPDPTFFSYIPDPHQRI